MCKRDGIGIEVYKNDKLVVEIFRDDTELSRKVTIYEKEIELDFLEKCIESFRENNKSWQSMIHYCKEKGLNLYKTTTEWQTFIVDMHWLEKSTLKDLKPILII